MLAVPQIYAEMEQLPVNLQIEVSHYVSFLLEKYKKNQMIVEPSLTEQEQRREELSKIMHEIAKEGTVFSRENIDVIAWQKEQRQDRVLIGREAD